MQQLFIQIIAGILGIWLATKFIPDVKFVGPVQILFLAGGILGIINFFIKPVIETITLPLRVLTLGLFTIIISMGFIWIIDILFWELDFVGILPLFWTAILVWGLNLFLSKWFGTKSL